MTTQSTQDTTVATTQAQEDDAFIAERLAEVAEVIPSSTPNLANDNDNTQDVLHEVTPHPSSLSEDEKMTNREWWARYRQPSPKDRTYLFARKGLLGLFNLPAQAGQLPTLNPLLVGVSELEQARRSNWLRQLTNKLPNVARNNANTPSYYSAHIPKDAKRKWFNMPLTIKFLVNWCVACQVFDETVGRRVMEKPLTEKKEILFNLFAYGDAESLASLGKNREGLPVSYLACGERPNDQLHHYFGMGNPDTYGAAMLVRDDINEATVAQLRVTALLSTLEWERVYIVHETLRNALRSDIETAYREADNGRKVFQHSIPQRFNYDPQEGKDGFSGRIHIVQLADNHGKKQYCLVDFDWGVDFGHKQGTWGLVLRPLLTTSRYERTRIAWQQQHQYLVENIESICNGEEPAHIVRPHNDKVVIYHIGGESKGVATGEDAVSDTALTEEEVDLFSDLDVLIG